EGVPLAVELAAAWVGTLTLKQIIGRLHDRFDLLVSRQAIASGRNTSLRAALDWSYQLLSPPIQGFFAHLGLFRGGWTLDAAEAVTAEPKALEYLAQLRERSLLMADEGPAGLRYSMLETVREYALEHLPISDRAAAVQRHQTFF